MHVYLRSKKMAEELEICHTGTHSLNHSIADTIAYTSCRFTIELDGQQIFDWRTDNEIRHMSSDEARREFALLTTKRVDKKPPGDESGQSSLVSAAEASRSVDHQGHEGFGVASWHVKSDARVEASPSSMNPVSLPCSGEFLHSCVRAC